MTLAYDDVVETAIATCEALSDLDFAGPVLLVQTLTGTVRLVLKDAEESTCVTVERALTGALQGWFEGPVISRKMGASGLSKLARHLWDDVQSRSRLTPEWTDRWPSGWPTVIAPIGQPERPLVGRWEALQVSAGKDPWIRSHPVDLPWPMLAQSPKITAFYGFKGGVGRTTTLAVLAWQLAREGKRVVCVDLDLEAPGLGPLLAEESDTLVTPGVIDVLLTHAVTGKVLPGPLLVKLPIYDVPGLYLMHAGRLGPTYVEKLARLDLAHRDGRRSRVHDALVALLHAIRQEVNPDHIFLDCRSGLHDLAGLALHDLAHVDVMVGRGDTQELLGLGVLLPQLLRVRTPPRERRLVFLRTFHSLPLDEARLLGQAEDIHTRFSEFLYDGEPPDVEDNGQAHYPWPIPLIAEVSTARWLGQISMTTLLNERYGQALNRLHALWIEEGVT